MNLKDFNESLNKRVGSKSVLAEASEFVMDKGKWNYVPKKSFLGGLLRVVVTEDSKDKWTIHYLAPASKASEGARKGAAKHMEDMQRLINLSTSMMLDEEVEGNAKDIEGWAVKGTWTGKYSDCINKCINLVEGKADAEVSKYTK